MKTITGLTYRKDKNRDDYWSMWWYIYLKLYKVWTLNNLSPSYSSIRECPRQVLCSVQGCQIKSTIHLINLWHRNTEKHTICSHATSLLACKLQPNVQTLADNDVQGQIIFSLCWCWLNSPHSLMLWQMYIFSPVNVFNVLIYNPPLVKCFQWNCS